MPPHKCAYCGDPIKLVAQGSPKHGIYYLLTPEELQRVIASPHQRVHDNRCRRLLAHEPARKHLRAPPKLKAKPLKVSHRTSHAHRTPLQQESQRRDGWLMLLAVCAAVGSVVASHFTRDSHSGCGCSALAAPRLCRCIEHSRCGGARARHPMPSGSAGRGRGRVPRHPGGSNCFLSRTSHFISSA